jgi:hypothetical protein
MFFEHAARFALRQSAVRTEEISKNLVGGNVMKSILTILLVLCVASPAMAAQKTIIWVTEGLDTANNATGAVGADGIADDKGWTDMLTAAGYNVNIQSQTLRWSNISLEEDAMLKSADLVIMSRNGASGTYTGIAGTNPDGTTGGATAYWNGLATPLVCLNGNLITNATNRWNWFGAGMLKTTLGLSAPTLDLTADGLGNPIVAFTNPVNQWELINATSAGNGTVLGVAAGGVLLTTGASADGLVMMAGWDAGFFVGTSGTSAGGKRLWFDASEYEKPGSGSVNTLTGPYDLTADGQALFLDTINGMMVPEPATLVVLGLGGLILRNRRSR